MRGVGRGRGRGRGRGLGLPNNSKSNPTSMIQTKNIALSRPKRKKNEDSRDLGKKRTKITNYVNGTAEILEILDRDDDSQEISEREEEQIAGSAETFEESDLTSVGVVVHSSQISDTVELEGVVHEHLIPISDVSSENSSEEDDEHDPSWNSTRNTKSMSSTTSSLAHPSSDSEGESDVTVIGSAKTLSTNSRVSQTKKRKRGLVGRKQDAVWNEFMGSRKEPICKYCNKQVSAQSHRLTKHLLRCPKKMLLNSGSKVGISTQVSKRLPLVGPSRSPVEVEVVELRDGCNQRKCSTSGNKNRGSGSSNLMGFVDTMSPAARDEFDLEVGKLIFECNLPFRIVEHPRFKSFVKKFKPAYELPSHDKIGDTILKKVFEEAILEVKSNVEGKVVSILQDGWSTLQNLPVISHCISTESNTYVLEAVETGTSSKTAEFCLDLLNSAKEKVINEYKCIPIACVTDNCSTMESMRSKITDMHVYGCHSHLLNLLGQKFTPTHLQEKIKLVQTFYRNHHFEGSALKTLKGNRPVLPCNTRWNSQLDTFRNYLGNRQKYIEISEMQDSNVTEDIQIILESRDILHDVKEILTVLEPISCALDKLQRERACIADGVHEWLDIQTAIRDFVAGGIGTQEIFDKYFNMAMTDVAIAAYMLHPGYRGKGLSPLCKERGRKWLTHKNPYYVIAAAALELGDNKFYPESMLNKEVSDGMEPTNWWSTISTWPGITHALATFANELMSLPATTAGIERVFSVVSNILTKKRNRLGITKAFQLCVIYMAAAMKNRYQFNSDDFE